MLITRRTLAQGAAGLAATALAAPAIRAVAAEPLVVVVEAEFGHPTSTSAQAIALGIDVAIDELNAARPGKPPFVLRRSDNAGVAAMAVDNFADAARDPSVIAVFGGKFSPVQIELVRPAHELGLLLLNPWGSADPITDHGRVPSWTFRLSLKDAWAAPAFVREARRRHAATALGILAPSTAWGRSNEAALVAATTATDTRLVDSRWYSWGTRSLVDRYQELRNAGAQAIVMVANEVEGALLVREVAALPAAERLPILCHWGVTGGQFIRLAGDALSQVDFSVVQTFSFHGNPRPAAIALREACSARLRPEAQGRIEAPVGVAHAYDLMHLLALAADRVGGPDRPAIRSALESLPPFAGAVRDYNPAFTPTRHDALGPENVFFARYTKDGDLMRTT